MKKQQRLSVLLALGLAVACSPAAYAGRVLSTLFPGGADAEVREEAPTVPRGVDNGVGTEHFEIANRIGATQNSHVYVKFNIRSVNAANLTHPITVRTHWSINNLAPNRIEDVLDLSVQDTSPADGVDDAPFADRDNVKFDYYVLNPNHAGADWDERRIAYNNAAPNVDLGNANNHRPLGTTRAPGLIFDANVATKDLQVNPANLTYLGENELRSLAHIQNPTTLGEQYIENRIPIGEAFDVTFQPGSPLHVAIAQALLTSHGTVTLVLTPQHTAASTNPGWVGFNYVFMPKEKSVVGVGAAPTFTGLDGWNPDTRIADYDPNTPGNQVPNSPWQGQANTLANPFAPQLRFIPEPGSMLLAGVCGLSLLMRRRMA